MDLETIAKINEQVYKQFPYLNDSSPNIQKAPDGAFMLKYSGSSETANGHVIPISIKVKASEAGDILQISSSR